MVKNNWIKNIKDLDPNKVKSALWKFSQDEVNAALTKRGIGGAKASSWTSWVNKVNKVNTDTSNMIWAEWYKEGQVKVPWVNIFNKPNKIDWSTSNTSETPLSDTWATNWGTWGELRIPWVNYDLDAKDTGWEITDKIWVWADWEETNIDGTTWYEDSNGNWVIEANEMSWDYKTFYDWLTPAEQKLFLATGQNAMDKNLDIAEAYANYMRDYETTKWRLEDDEDYRLKQEWINNEINDIQQNQAIRRARDNVSKLKQSIAYLWNLWMPWVSAQRIVSLERSVSDAERSVSEMVKMQSLANKARGNQNEQSAKIYERKIEDIATKLNDNVDKAIQDTFNTLVADDNNGKLDTVEELTAFRDKMYADLDKSITWFTDASISQMTYLAKQVDAAVKEQREYEANAFEINDEYSELKWFYTDWNNNQIIWEDGQAIKFVPEPPMKPIYDSKTWNIITFANDEFGNIVPTVNKTENATSLTNATATQYARMVSEWIISAEKAIEINPSLANNSTFLNAVGKYNESDSTDWGTWKQSVDGRLYNDITWEYKEEWWDVNSEIMWVDYSLLDWSTNQEMIDKYKWEASFKNNNPTWITYQAASQKLKNLWTEAWIEFEKGSFRPELEWNNYVKFNSVWDWLEAYNIALTKRWDDIFNRLSTWVWTQDEASNERYSKELMDMAWIERWTKFNQLDENQLWALMSVQLQKESPYFYQELMNLEKKWDTDEIIWDLWVPISYERQIKQMVPPTLMNSEIELEALNSTIKKMWAKWLPVEDAVLTYLWFNINKTSKKEALNYINVGRNLGEDLPDNFYATVSNYINKGNIEWVDKYVWNIVEDKAKKRYGEDLVSTADMNLVMSDTRNLTRLIQRNPDKIWAYDWTVTDILKKFKDMPEMQELSTLLTMKQAWVRKHFAWSAVTPSEMEALVDFIWGSIKMTPNNLMTMLDTIQERTRAQYLQQRKQFWYEPKLKDKDWKIIGDTNKSDPLWIIEKTTIENTEDPLWILN